MSKNPRMIKLIKGYQKNKAIIGTGHCRFYPTCSNYAIEAYKKFNFFHASILTFWRILRCNPLTKRKYDPVPLTKQEKKIQKRLMELRKSDLREIVEVLLDQNQRYPKAKIQDYYKLLFQSYYGPNHLLHTNTQTGIILQIEEELKDVQEGNLPYIEPIGNGYARVPLRLINENLSIVEFSNAFLKSLEYEKKLNYSFESTIQLLHELIDMKVIFIEGEKENLNLDQTPRHTKTFKENYHPHYRIINQEFLTRNFYLSEIRDFVESLKLQKKRIIIAIDGPAASGKSTLASLLKEELKAEVIPVDHFFLPEQMKTKKRLKESGGNIHYERILSEVLIPLQKDEPFSYLSFNCSNQSLETVQVDTTKHIFIIEGVYSYHPALASFYDLLIYVDIDEETQKNRLKIRSPRLFDKFMEEWLPLEQNYFQKNQVKKFANIIVWGNF